MNFFKVRQKATGLFFCGGRGFNGYFAPSFNEDGMHYNTLNTASAGRNHCIKWNSKRMKHLAEAPNLDAESLEIVEFKQVEVGVVAKTKKK